MILTTALLDKEMHKPIIRMCETNPGQEKKVTQTSKFRLPINPNKPEIQITRAYKYVQKV